MGGLTLCGYEKYFIEQIQEIACGSGLFLGLVGSPTNSSEFQEHA